MQLEAEWCANHENSELSNIETAACLDVAIGKLHTDPDGDLGQRERAVGGAGVLVDVAVVHVERPSVAREIHEAGRNAKDRLETRFQLSDCLRLVPQHHLHGST